MKIERKSIIKENPEIVHSSQFDSIELNFLLAYLESGDTENVPDELLAYMELMEIIYGLSRRLFDFPNDSAIISHIMILYGFKRPKAMQLLKDAMMYFSKESIMPNEVHRQRLSENGTKTFIAALRVAKSSRDFKDAFMILLELGKFLKWDEDPLDEKDENFIRQLQVITSDVTMFGLDKIDRNELGSFVDHLDIPQKMKDLAKLEVDKVPFKLLFTPETNPRKD